MNLFFRFVSIRSSISEVATRKCKTEHKCVSSFIEMLVCASNYATYYLTLRHIFTSIYVFLIGLLMKSIFI
jgi:hypothetical protein